MVEFYVKDYVFMAIDIPPTTGRIGLTAANVTSALRWWPMALPGGNFVQVTPPPGPPSPSARTDRAMTSSGREEGERGGGYVKF
jgi:hypothetical protein